MRYCVTQKQMQDIEYDTIMNTGIPSIVLMERAALAVEEVIRRRVDKKEIIHVVCGKGNNGADGIAVARLLLQKGYEVSIVTVGDESRATEKYTIQEGIARKLGISFINGDIWNPVTCDCIVDGIFGIGLTRAVDGDYRNVIEKIGTSNCKNIIAIDIPSGISSDTGAVLGCAIKANVTVTFEYEKLGLHIGRGRSYAGEVIVAQIGFDSKSVDRIGYAAKLLEETDLSRIPQRLEDANKGTYGRLLIIAGSKGMCGAAYLSAKAAYRCGAGLVKILTVKENLQILQMQLPEAIIQVYKKETICEIVKSECNWATTILMGPGLGQDPYVRELVETALKECNTPLVLDSDALNTIATYPELKQYYSENTIITPHMKEMSRLTGKTIEELKRDSISNCQEYAGVNEITCLLKDAVSVISNGKDTTYVNTSGNSALAKAGSGDVLAGIVAGLLCIGMLTTESAAFASYIHGRAGTKCAEMRGKHGVLASDLFEQLPGENS